MIIKPKYKDFICMTAHPVGCYKNIEDMVKEAAKLDQLKGPKNVVVVGSSSGYGMASRVVAAFGCHAKTVGISFERESSGKRTGSAGYYNNQAFETLAKEQGIPCRTINVDAFSAEGKDAVVSACRELFDGEKIDLLIYSLAAPRRKDPETGESYASVIKPIGDTYSNKTVDFHTGRVSEVSIAPASEDEVRQTIKVMGGEDWNLWIERMISEDLLSDDFCTVAYSYIGPKVTHPVYKNGTIGRAKDNLQEFGKQIHRRLKPLGGSAYVSVNKALVTQSSSAIPVVPLYISMLYRVMKEAGNHEGCLEQMIRLFRDRLYSGKTDIANSERKIRMDDYEMEPEIQDRIAGLWGQITTENVEELTDIKGYREEFFSLFGFSRSDVDYDADVAEF